MSNPNSFRLNWFGHDQYGQNVFLNAPLASVTVWTTNQQYNRWNISFNYAAAVSSNISHIQVILRSNDEWHAAVRFGSVNDLSRSEGLTSVEFRGAPTAYSTSTAQHISTIAFVAPCTMRQVINSMTTHIPGYRLRSDKQGSDGWTFLVLRGLARDGFLGPHTFTQLAMDIQMVRFSSLTAMSTVPDTPVYGTVVKLSY